MPTLAYTAARKALTSNLRHDIGLRFATCVAQEILNVTKRMCATRRGRQLICSACKTKSITKLDKLIRPQVLKRFSCIPCAGVQAAINFSFVRLIKVLFPNICRMCKCR
jgi:hypothetical protein